MIDTKFDPRRVGHGGDPGRCRQAIEALEKIEKHRLKQLPRVGSMMRSYITREIWALRWAMMIVRQTPQEVQVSAARAVDAGHSLDISRAADPAKLASMAEDD